MIQNKIKQLILDAVPVSGAVTFTFADLHQLLSIVGLSVTIIYTVFKFYKDFKEK